MTKIVLRRSVTVQARHRLVRTVIGAGTAVVLLTGCTGTSHDKDDAGGSQDVASVVSSSSATQKNSGTADSTTGEAPQRRLDTTEEETLTMFQPYLQCLKDHDVPIDRAGRGGRKPGDGKGGEVDPSMLWYASADMADYPAAEKACDPIRPLMPRELDPKTNPDYLEDFRAQIECMEAKGVKVTALPDGSGWNYRDGYESTAETAQIEQDCQMKAFGDQD